MEKDIKLNIHPEGSKKRFYIGLGSLLLILSGIIAYISLFIFLDQFFLISLIFLLICMVLDLKGLIFIIGSVSNYIKIDGNFIIIKNYLKEIKIKLEDIYKIKYDLSVAPSGEFLPINELKISSKKGVSEVNLRYYSKAQKRKIEKIMDQIMKTYLSLS